MALGITSACGTNPCSWWETLFPFTGQSQDCLAYLTCLPDATFADLVKGNSPTPPQPPGPNVPYALTGDLMYDIGQTTVTGDQIAANVIANIPDNATVQPWNWYLLGAVALGLIWISQK